MKIDLLRDKKNNVIVSDANELSSSMIANSFSTKSTSDILSWKMYNENITESTFTILSNSISKLKKIKYEIPDVTCKIETSHDFCNWFELPFRQSTDGNIYKLLSNGKFQNIFTFEILDDIENNEYVFSYIDEFNTEVELYNSYEFLAIRFTFTNVTASVLNPLRFIYLEIIIDEDFDMTFINKYLLSVRSSMLYRPKIYYEYEFLPSIIETFTDMLQTNGLDPGKKTYYQNSTLEITEI